MLTSKQSVNNARTKGKRKVDKNDFHADFERKTRTKWDFVHCYRSEWGVNLFTNAGTIQNVRFNRTEGKNDKITLEFEKFTVKLFAIGDCCSRSYFDLPKKGRQSFKDLIGKSIVKHESKHVMSKVRGPYNYEYQKIDDETFTLCNGDKFTFRLHNISNGFYSGWWEAALKYKTPVKPNADSQVVIIIGLPSSGKTIYTKNNFDPAEYVVMDDCLRYPLAMLKIRESIAVGKKLVVNDPRFCCKYELEKLYSLVAGGVEDVSKQLYVVYFENTPKPNLPDAKARKAEEWEIGRMWSKYDHAIQYIESLSGVVLHKLPIST